MKKEKTRVMFVCLGNICRSPMAEAVFRKLVRDAGREGEFEIDSTAVSREELGNPVYPPARAVLRTHGIVPPEHHARLLTREDCERFDLLIGMDDGNIRAMRRIAGEENAHKVSKLLGFAGRTGNVADPWFTGDFEEAYRDIEEGCRGLLASL